MGSRRGAELTQIWGIECVYVCAYLQGVLLHETAEQVYETRTGFSDGGGKLQVGLWHSGIMALCMLDGNNLVKAHDCYMQLEPGIKHDCCFHVCMCRIIL